jgi:hypothetical protein
MEDKSKTISKQTTSAEGWMLKNGMVGQTFFTEKNDKSMTAFAKYYKRKVKTERIIFQVDCLLYGKLIIKA